MLARLRQKVSTPRVVIAAWVVCAAVVWNVVFDWTIVLAGRRYVRAAATAAGAGAAYERIDDWMRPAVTQGLWTATAAAAVIVTIGVAGVRLAARRPR